MTQQHQHNTITLIITLHFNTTFATTQHTSSHPFHNTSDNIATHQHHLVFPRSLGAPATHYQRNFLRARLVNTTPDHFVLLPRLWCGGVRSSLLRLEGCPGGGEGTGLPQGVILVVVMVVVVMVVVVVVVVAAKLDLRLCLESNATGKYYKTLLRTANSSSMIICLTFIFIIFLLQLPLPI